MKLILLLSLLMFTTVDIHAVFGGWRSLKTRHYTVFFTEENERHALEALNSLEYYRYDVIGLTGSDAAKLPVVIEDMGTLSNGLANPVFNYIRLFPYPPSSQWGIDNWMSYVAKHELIHIHHFNNISGAPGGLRRLFGRLFMPNILSPGWVFEGIAVYGESTSRSFCGRMNDGYYDTYMRVRTSDQNFPSLLEATYSPEIYPFREGIYLFGGGFFDYLAQQYGEDSFAEFFTHYGGSMLSYLSPVFPWIGLDRSARHVYGKSFPHLWDEWQEYLVLSSAHYEISGHALTADGYYKDQVEFHEGDVYYSHRYRKKTGAATIFGFNKIVKLNQESPETIISTTSPITHFTLTGDDLWYAVYEIKESYPNTFNDAYGYNVCIRRKNLKTKEDTAIITAEIRTFTVSNAGVIYYSVDRRDQFGSYVFAYNPKTGRRRQVLSSSFLINGIRFYGERIFVSAKQDWENLSIYELMPDENADGYTLNELVRTPYLEYLVDAESGKIFFTANYDNIHHLYYFDLDEDQLYKCQGEGLIRNAAYNPETNHIYLSGLNNAGFDIYRRELKGDRAMEPTEEFQPPIPNMPADMKIKEGNYFDNLKTLLPAIRIPVLSSDNEETIAGMYLQGTDAIGHFEYFGNFLYDFNDEKFLSNLTVSSKLFLPVRKSISYDNSGDDESLELAVSRPFFHRLQPGVSHIGGQVSARLFDNYDRTEYIPQLSARIHYPGLQAALSLRTPIESRNFGSNMDRQGGYFTGTVYKYLHNSHLNLNFHGIYDPDNPETVFPVIKGYDDELGARRGVVISSSITAPLLTINRGLWNPNIFFEDLNGSLFINTAIPDEGDSQLAGGVEFVVDGGVFFLGNSFWGVRMAYNIDNDFSSLLFFGNNFSW